MISNDLGDIMYQWAEFLFPINRSITGQGVRDTLKFFKQIIPELEIKSFPTGFRAFDWEVPKEWNITDAYILDCNGSKIVDFKKNNLHIVGYSKPISEYMELEDLISHLYYIENQPDAVPYVTSYYKKSWGFCLTYNQFKSLKKGKYFVHIDSNFSDGVLNYGEILIPGKRKEEIFLSSYICHPSMANNELSGPIVTIALANELRKKSNEFSYRLILIPETIGSICYLKENLELLKQNVIAGYNISCVGDDNDYSFLPSRNENTISDKVALNILNKSNISFKTYSWLERGSDERQYCWPGIDLPIASIMRTKYGEYPEYHTSLDNLNYISKEGLLGSLKIYLEVILALEHNKKYLVKTLAEPKLDKRGLYSTLSKKGSSIKSRTILNFLSYCDGYNDLIDISNKIELPISDTIELKELLLSKGLIELYE